MQENKLLTQLEFKGDDHIKAKKIAKKLGYNQFAYTSSSDLIGLFCLVDHDQYKKGKNKGCIIKTKQFGFMFVQDCEDLGIHEEIYPDGSYYNDYKKDIKEVVWMKQKIEKIFILDNEEGFKLAEEFKAELENKGCKVKTSPYALNGVRISGMVEVVWMPCTNCQGENARTGYVELWDGICPDCGRGVKFVNGRWV